MPKATRTGKKWTKRKRAWGGRYPMRKWAKSGPRRYLSTLPVGGVPKVKYVKLRHCSIMTLDPGSNSYAIQNVNLSDPTNVFDTSANQQVVGNWSTHIQSYEKWTPVAAQVTIRVTPTLSGNQEVTSVPGYIGIFIDNESNAINNVLVNGLQELLEQPRNTSMKAMPWTTQGSPQELTMSRTVDHARFFQIDEKDLWGNEDDFSGNVMVPTQPAKNVFANIWYASLDGNNPSKIVYICQVDYIIRFSEPKVTRAI